MEIVIENLPGLNDVAPAPEETVAEEALATNIDRLADEVTTQQSESAAPAENVGPTENVGHVKQAGPTESVGHVRQVRQVRPNQQPQPNQQLQPDQQAQPTRHPTTYMPLPDNDNNSTPIFLNRIRTGFWDLPEIAFD